jgi:hypothetical protein
MWFEFRPWSSGHCGQNDTFNCGGGVFFFLRCLIGYVCRWFGFWDLGRIKGGLGGRRVERIAIRESLGKSSLQAIKGPNKGTPKLNAARTWDSHLDHLSLVSHLLWLSCLYPHYDLWPHQASGTIGSMGSQKVLKSTTNLLKNLKKHSSITLKDVREGSR